MSSIAPAAKLVVAAPTACSTCGLDFTPSQQGILVQNLHVHAHCFRCSICGVRLPFDAFLWAGATLYCGEHYYDSYARTCCICNQHTLDALLSYKGTYYHPNCAHCKKCGRKITFGQPLNRNSSELFCRDCDLPPLSCLFNKQSLRIEDAEALLQSVGSPGSYFLYVPDNAALKEHKYSLAFWATQEHIRHFPVILHEKVWFLSDRPSDAFAELDELLWYYIEHVISDGYALNSPIEFPEAEEISLEPSKPVVEEPTKRKVKFPEAKTNDGKRKIIRPKSNDLKAHGSDAVSDRPRDIQRSQSAGSTKMKKKIEASKKTPSAEDVNGEEPHTLSASKKKGHHTSIDGGLGGKKKTSEDDVNNGIKKKVSVDDINGTFSTKKKTSAENVNSRRKSDDITHTFGSKKKTSANDINTDDVSTTTTTTTPARRKSHDTGNSVKRRSSDLEKRKSTAMDDSSSASAANDVTTTTTTTTTSSGSGKKTLRALKAKTSKERLQNLPEASSADTDDSVTPTSTSVTSAQPQQQNTPEPDVASPSTDLPTLDLHSIKVHEEPELTDEQKIDQMTFSSQSPSTDAAVLSIPVRAGSRSGEWRRGLNSSTEFRMNKSYSAELPQSEEDKLHLLQRRSGARRLLLQLPLRSMTPNGEFSPRFSGKSYSSSSTPQGDSLNSRLAVLPPSLLTILIPRQDSGDSLVSDGMATPTLERVIRQTYEVTSLANGEQSSVNPLALNEMARQERKLARAMSDSRIRRPIDTKKHVPLSNHDESASVEPSSPTRQHAILNAQRRLAPLVPLHSNSSSGSLGSSITRDDSLASAEFIPLTDEIGMPALSPIYSPRTADGAPFAVPFTFSSLSAPETPMPSTRIDSTATTRLNRPRASSVPISEVGSSSATSSSTGGASVAHDSSGGPRPKREKSWSYRLTQWFTPPSGNTPTVSPITRKTSADSNSSPSTNSKLKSVVGSR